MRPRERRYGLRRLLWDQTEIKGLRKCGRVRRSAQVGIRCAPGMGAGFSGLVTCGSVWACPVCSAKILARRSLEVGVALLSWETRGGALLMGTFTMRHHSGVRLAAQFDALNVAWKALIGSVAWRKWRRRLGSPGLVRVVEVTYGVNGWHVHVHFVVCVDGASSADLCGAFGAWATAKWIRSLAAAGMPGALELGQDVHRVDGVRAASDLGEYLAKATAYGSAEAMGRELMGQWSKSARGAYSTRPAWALAEGFGETGDLALLDLWHEYERGSKGRRQVTWTRGLRQLLAVGVELSDEEIAEEVQGAADLLWITAAGWETAWRSPVPTSRILDAVEAGGLVGLRDYLDRQGIEYQEVG